jgi:hypothetical protein
MNIFYTDTQKNLVAIFATFMQNNALGAPSHKVEDTDKVLDVLLNYFLTIQDFEIEIRAPYGNGSMIGGRWGRGNKSRGHFSQPFLPTSPWDRLLKGFINACLQLASSMIR